MKRLLSIFAALVIAAVSAGPAMSWKHGNAGTPTPPSCNTYPGATCDVNGWTVFTPVGSWCVGQPGSSPACNALTTDTQIVLISQSTGVDDGTCGTAAHPCQTAHFAASHYGRPGSPDWFLFACGDTWSQANTTGGVRPDFDFHQAMAQGPGTGAFGGTAGPLLISSYDTGASTNPPVPDPVSCSARPTLISDIAGADGIGSDTYTAVVGLANYCPGRDPNNAATTAPFFSVSESLAPVGGLGLQGGAPYPAGPQLVEDVYLAYCGGGMAFNTTPYPPSSWPTKLLLRRNVVINNYPVNTESSGIAVGFVTGNDPTNNVLYQNVIDSNTYLNLMNFPSSALSVTWAPKSGFSHNIYVAGQCGNGDVLCTNGPITFDGNMVGNDPTSPAFRTVGNYNNGLWLLNPRNLSLQLPNPIVGTVNKNVFLDMGVGGGGTGIELGVQYVNEPTNDGAETVTQNIWANSPQMNFGSTILFDSSGDSSNGGVGSGNTRANGNTVTGNYLYNVSGGNNSVAFSQPPSGAIIAGTFTAGSGYTAKGSTITSGAQSTEQPTSQNYVVALLASMNGFVSVGPDYSLAGNLGTIAGGPNNSVLGMYQSEICATNSNPSCASFLFVANSTSTYNSGTGAFVFASQEPPAFVPGAQVNITGLFGQPNPSGPSATVQATGSSYNSGTGALTLNLNTGLTNGDSISVTGLTGTSATVQATGSSYTAGTVVLNLNTALTNGDSVSVSGITGTGTMGDIAQVNGTFTVTVVGNTISYSIPGGLNITSITGGTVADNTSIAAAQGTFTISGISGTTVTYPIGTGLHIATVTSGTVSDLTSFAALASGGPYTVTATTTSSVSFTAPTGLHIATIGQNGGALVPINGPIVFQGSSFSGSYSGSIYFPYQAVAPTCHTAGCMSGTASGFNMDVIVDGSGHVAATWLLGDDGACVGTTCGSFTAANGNDPGVNYTVGDVLDIPLLGGTGTNAQFTVTQIASNNASPGNNAMDAAGTNNNSQTGQPWPDPNRTAGWYYAKHIVGATAKATFTGVISNSGKTLTVSGWSGGSLYPGDAVIWSGSNADFIKSYSGGVITTLGNLSASACSSGCSNNTYSNIPLVGGHGSGATATVVVSGVTPTVISVTATGGGPGSGYAIGDVLSVAPASIGGSVGGLTNFTVTVTVTASGACGIGTCTGGGGNGTYELSAGNSGACGGGGCSMSSYSTEQLIQAMYGLSKHNWDNNSLCSPSTNHCLTAPVINSVIAQGFGLTW